MNRQTCAGHFQISTCCLGQLDRIYQAPARRSGIFDNPTAPHLSLVHRDFADLATPVIADLSWQWTNMFRLKMHFASFCQVGLPSGKWKIAIFYGKIHYKWPFSIAMLNYQRVAGLPKGNWFSFPVIDPRTAPLQHAGGVAGALCRLSKTSLSTVRTPGWTCCFCIFSYKLHGYDTCCYKVSILGPFGPFGSKSTKGPVEVSWTWFSFRRVPIKDVSKRWSAQDSLRPTPLSSSTKPRRASGIPWKPKTS